MKKSIILIMASALLFTGCSQTADETDGTVSFEIKPDLSVTDLTKGSAGDYAAVPALEDFCLRITNAASEIAWEGAYKEWPGELKLSSGEYAVIIYSGNEEEEGAGKPYFAAEEKFTIIPFERTSIVLRPSLANCIVKIVKGSYLKEYFKSCTCSITTSLNTIDIEEGDVVFINAGEVTLNCSYSMQNGQTGSFEKTFGSLSAGTCYTVRVALSNVGGLAFEISFDDTLETVTIDEDVNPLAETI